MIHPNNFTDVDLDDVHVPERFANRYPDVVGSLSRLRYLLRCRETNGLSRSGAVVQRGKKLYIVAPRFCEWLLGEGKGL